MKMTIDLCVPYKAHALFAAAEHAPKIQSYSKMENFAQLQH